jgi:urease accessory protein
MTGTHIRVGLLSLSILAISCSPALAHSDGHFAHGIWHGMAHPITGWDHLIAMVVVGLWGAFLGSRAMLLLPAIFPVIMAAGAAAAIAGISIPAVEIGIPASVSTITLIDGVSATPIDGRR